MAKFNIVGLDDFMKSINQRTKRAVEKIPKMLEEGAKVLAAAQRAEAKAMGIEDTGATIKSIKATKIKTDPKTGCKYVDVYPHGKDKDGKSNAEKAFIAEYGRKQDTKKFVPRKRGIISLKYHYGSLAPRPYMTAANAKAESAVMDAERKVWEADND